MTSLPDPSARTRPPHVLRPWSLPRAESPTIEELRSALLHAADAQREDIVARFRARLEDEGTPLIEPDEQPGFSKITFVWLGEAPYGVVVQLNRIADPLDPEDTLLERIAGSEVHALTLRLPSDWQGSYLFVVLPQPVRAVLHQGVDPRVLATIARFSQTDPHARERIPSKAVMASAGLALPEYAAARGPEAPRTALWAHPPVAATALAAVPSPANGAELPLHHVATSGAGDASPVILLADGEVWREQFPLAAELERRGAPGVHLLFLGSGGPRQRELDYPSTPVQSEALLRAVRSAAAEVVPEAPWIVAGQSFGGLFAALCAVRHPALVRAAVAQSPSLWWPSAPSPWRGEPGWFEEAAAAERIAPVLLEAGAIDAGVIERARPAAALLRSRGSLIDFRVHAAGHDVLQWQATLADALLDALAAG